jgi:alginate O-acetyltransferase complex protein AlgI
MNKNYFKLWIFSILIIGIIKIYELGYKYETIVYLSKFLAPVIFSSIVIIFYKKLIDKYSKVSIYLSITLFFIISLTSVIGVTQTLTGEISKSESALATEIIFGISFYTAALAYYIKREKIEFNDLWKVTNPILLFTGPIPIYFNRHSNKLFKRVKYYFPYIIIGYFKFKIIAAPLTQFFWMLEVTNIFITLLFCIIFEVFVYANFAGLSLIIFGLFGILGIKIPLNFKQPFTSSNIIEFWKGWHISLSAVLQEIFYKTTKNLIGTYLSVFVVFMASSLWHGVSINFFLWGLFHAGMFILTINLLKYKLKKTSIIIMFFSLIFGRFLFAESNAERLMQKILINRDYESLYFEKFLESDISAFIALFFGLFIISVEFFWKNNKIISKKTYKYLRTPFSQFIIILMIVLFITDSGGNEYAVYGQR